MHCAGRQNSIIENNEVTESNDSRLNPWPHRLAVVLACATFPLIWIGGLVTTVDAGMAVEDWPTTFGYPLLFYPLVKWLYGPADVFIEHGHRLYASGIGMLTIAAMIVTCVCDTRRWVKVLSVVALATVIGQGLLGGLRVIEDEVLLAKIHGCVGPVFFAICAAWATVTSKRWQNRGELVESRFAAAIQRLALFTTVLAYVQLVLGAQLRHMPLTMTPAAFRSALVFHLFVAAILSLHIVALAVLAWWPQRQDRWVRWPSTLLAVLLSSQLLLGAGTWITKYGYPQWLADPFGWAGYTVLAQGPAQVVITTTHVAIGSLILVVSLAVTLRSFRVLRQASQSTAVAAPVLAMGAVT